MNIYRLVRALIISRPALDLLENRHHVLGWLILCEQWPYAAHTMLEILDQHLKGTDVKPEDMTKLANAPILELYEAAHRRIDQEENVPLKKLDLKYERLQSFIQTHLPDLTVADLQRLRPFTVNFNPALSAEVRLTLNNAAS